MIKGSPLVFGPYAKFPHTKVVRKILREGTNDWIGVLIEERMTPEEFMKQYPENFARKVVQLLLAHDCIYPGKGPAAVKVLEELFPVTGSSDGSEQSVDNRQVAGSSPAPSTNLSVPVTNIPGACSLMHMPHFQMTECIDWHIICPCWATGKFLRVEGCRHHPYDM